MTSLSPSCMTRRESVRLIAGAAACIGASFFVKTDPAGAAQISTAATIIPYVEDMTWGDLIRQADPDDWDSLQPNVQNVLDSIPLLPGDEEPLLSGVGGSATVSATGGQGVCSYSCSYTTQVNCPQLCVQVAFVKSNVVYYYSDKFTAEFSTYVRGTGIVKLDAGTYDITSLGYPSVPPDGYEIEYSRAFTSAVVS